MPGEVVAESPPAFSGGVLKAVWTQVWERIKQFGRGATSSIAAAAADYGLVIFLVEVVGIWYVPAVVAGSVLGGVVSFWLSSRWVFAAQRAGIPGEGRRQVVNFTLIYGLGTVLFTGLVYGLTDGLGMHYLAAKIVSGAALFAVWNFPLQRRFVFTLPDARRKPHKAHSSPRPTAAAPPAGGLPGLAANEPGVVRVPPPRPRLRQAVHFLREARRARKAALVARPPEATEAAARRDEAPAGAATARPPLGTHCS